MNYEEMIEKYGEDKTEDFIFSFYDKPMREIVEIIIGLLTEEEIEKIMSV